MSINNRVVLIHGLGGSRLDMWPVARRLRRAGFRVDNWGYRSLGNRIETHAARLTEKLLSLDQESSDSKFHLVGYSMGAIIARAALANTHLENLGRVVMLAPPNCGSHVARKLSPYFGWLTPSLAQLSDAQDSYVNCLENSLQEKAIEFGIIEAGRDRVIAKGGVRLPGNADFASVDSHHGILTWYSQTIQLVENFLIRGSFQAEPNHSAEYGSQPPTANVA
jgi:pimeloyl-ACP methyl ester carboxylesterase